MSFKTATAAMFGAFATTALAHGTVVSFSTDGTSHDGYDLSYYYLKQNGQPVPEVAAWSAENLDNGFVAPDAYGSVDINCHIKSAPGPISVSVAAGGTVDFQWSEWPESHFGPVFTYVAKCDGDCSAADPAALKWVKIDEGGIDIATQKWAATSLIENGNLWTTTVPETLAAGNYVFRHEIIAMHGAGSVGGAQNYPQCFNIEITGSGTDNPEGVLGTELYTAEHPGIVFNPYSTLESYEIPGPALYGSGSGTPPSNPPSTPTTPVTPPATPQPTRTATPTPTSLVPQPTPTTSVPSVPEVPAPPPASEDGDSEELPQTFTLETFISWLREKAGGQKARRHARAF